MVRWGNFILVGLLLLLFLKSDAQIVYKNNDGSYVQFINDTQVEFCVVRPSCMGETWLCGCVILKNKRKSLYVYRNEARCDWSKFSASKYVKTPIHVPYNEFEISSTTEERLGGVSIRYKSDHDWEGVVSDPSGYARLRINRMPIDSMLCISYVGYQELAIPVKDLNAYSYKVTLHDGNVDFFKKGTMRIIDIKHSNRILLKLYGESFYLDSKFQ